MKKTLLLISIAFNFFNSNAQVVSPNGITATYSFTGNANDGSGNNLNGIVNGATLTADRFGNTNAAYFFNGTGAYIEIPSSILVGLNEYTYAYWAKPDANLTGSNMGIISVGGDSPNPVDNYDQASSYTTNNQFFCGGYNYGTPLQTKEFSGQTFAINTWHHVTVVRSLTQIKLFVDGVLMSCSTSGSDCSTSGTTAHYGLATTKRFALGNICYLPSNYSYHGILDDLTFFNRAIGDTEVIGLFNNQFTGKNEITNNTNLIISPNPSNNIVNISSATIINKVSLYAIDGRLIESYILSNKNNSTTIDISSIAKGCYLLNIQLVDGKAITKKIIKE